MNFSRDYVPKIGQLIGNGATKYTVVETRIQIDNDGRSYCAVSINSATGRNHGWHSIESFYPTEPFKPLKVKDFKDGKDLEKPKENLPEEPIGTNDWLFQAPTPLVTTDNVRWNVTFVNNFVDRQNFGGGTEEIRAPERNPDDMEF